MVTICGSRVYLHAISDHCRAFRARVRARNVVRIRPRVSSLLGLALALGLWLLIVVYKLLEK